MKRILLYVFIAVCGLPSSAQSSLQETLDDSDVLNHLDVSVILGTTGIGFDFAAPVTNYAQLRVGYAFMPSFHKSMYFGVQVGDEPESK